ncbi:sigma-70 family RNA polymerase sigma factor [Actinoplanes sp. TBRC 11911]|uniref:sigma-70 family RNA polymerase sigma factor n=1 Tax=Actinoplanes sp. TBRC 11911 TaxID=2729386 RepID=UPI00145DEF49|nr:sigma-70 family RNA polymerase sigma factor [Actinoplanes sp. TBRC 11911]NMO49950.1 sigma-70 family RNA polymerase sigma factor [Actinoplanes sp. TBRC 11911]
MRVAEAPQRLTMARLHDEHAQPVLHFLLALFDGDRFEAEDLLQETMLRAWRRLDFLPADHQELRRWLLAAARQSAAATCRRRQSWPQEVPLDYVPVRATGDEPEESVLTALVVRKALDGLTKEQRSTMEDLYVHGCSLRQAAAFHGIPVGTVKARAHYAVQALKRAVV